MPSTAPLLGRCKECDFALFVADATQAADVNGFRDVKADGRAYHVGNDGFFARCPSRHRVFSLKRIKGTYSPDHKCDARCLNAKGHNCTCSCGGMNHGRGHATVAVTATTESVTLAEPPTGPMVRYIKILLDERVIPWKFTEAATGDISPERRKAEALRQLDAGEMTKNQAHKIIDWLLTLPKKS